jgi:MoaA/NifB/PqqE/SkfB family radical SAM enzyme
MNYAPNKMTDELFDKFIEDIKDKPIERIIPYLNNEPFLQEDFVSRVRRIREANPNAEIEISTNLTFFSEDKMWELKEIGVTEIRASVFGFTHDTYKRMMPTANRDKAFMTLEKLSEVFKGSNTTIGIVMIDTGDIAEDEFESMENFADSLGFEFNRWGFLDRAKNVSGRSNEFHRDDVFGCEQNRPTERLHLLCDGRVIFCCQDWSHTCVCGNLNNNTISEIWTGDKYNALRTALFSQEYSAPGICKDCKLAICR